MSAPTIGRAMKTTADIVVDPRDPKSTTTGVDRVTSSNPSPTSETAELMIAAATAAIAHRPSTSPIRWLRSHATIIAASDNRRTPQTAGTAKPPWPELGTYVPGGSASRAMNQFGTPSTWASAVTTKPNRS